MRKKGCIFCDIANGDMPAHIWYADDMFAAVLDRFPKCAGHTLIIPTAHADNIYDLPDEAAARLMPLAKTLAKRLRGAYNCAGLNLIQNNGEAAGQQVTHFHLHLIPRYDADDFVMQWKPTDPSPEAFKEAAALLKQERP